MRQTITTRAARTQAARLRLLWRTAMMQPRGSMRFACSPIAGALALGAAGCAQVIGANDYRLTDGGPGTSGLSADAAADATSDDDGVDLSCLGSVEWPAPSADQLAFGLARAVDANGYLFTVNGLIARACYEILEDCGSLIESEKPVPASWTFLTRDPYSNDRFFGHLETHDPSLVFFDYLFYFFPHPGQDAQVSVGVWKRSDLALALRAYVDLVPGLGIVSFAAYDCRSAGDGYLLPPSGGGRAVPGVSVSIDGEPPNASAPGPTYFYGYPPAPDPTGHTDVNGLVLIANVAPGVRTVRATERGEPFGEVTVRVEADSVTSFHMVPTPLE